MLEASESPPKSSNTWAAVGGEDMRLAWRQTRAPGHAGVRPRQARARGYQLQRAGPQLARGAFARAVQERTPERTSCSPVQLINLVPAQHARTSRPVTRGPELEDRNGAYLHCSRCVCSAECVGAADTRPQSACMRPAS